jgi:hypothetical protein
MDMKSSPAPPLPAPIALNAPAAGVEEAVPEVEASALALADSVVTLSSLR